MMNIQQSRLQGLACAFSLLFLCNAGLSEDFANEELSEFEMPEVMAYYMPVVWENPFTRLSGRPVVDVILDREGKVIQSDLITREYKDMEDILKNSVETCVFRPAYAEGAPIEGFVRFPVQSCLFLKDRERDKGHIDKLPAPRFRISRNTMTKIFFYARNTRKTGFGFHVTVDAEGNISRFEGIEDESKVLASTYLEKFAPNFKFHPAESNGKPVKCSMTMVLFGFDGHLKDSTKELVARNFIEEMRPLPEKSESTTISSDREISVGLGFFTTGVVGNILLLSQAPSVDAIAAINSFRKWKMDKKSLSKMKGQMEVVYRYPDGGGEALLVDEKEGPFVTKPKATRQSAPDYPRELLRAGTEGYVVIEFFVDKNGRVQNPVPITSTHLGFTQEAMAVVKKWRFKPGEKNGRPIATRVRQLIPFKIKK